MQVNELRIGNLIKYRDYICAIESISHNFITITFDYVEFGEAVEKTISTGIKHIYPIALTEEWLLKFGFKNKSIDIDNYKAFHIEFDDKLESVWLEDYELTKCKYVHQLQNLYFALTGTELEIK
jgi:hypothetical protein